MPLSTFSLLVVTFAIGVLCGISAASAAFGDHPRCAGSIEVWERRVVEPCEHWNPPTPRDVERVRVR